MCILYIRLNVALELMSLSFWKRNDSQPSGIAYESRSLAIIRPILANCLCARITFLSQSSFPLIFPKFVCYNVFDSLVSKFRLWVMILTYIWTHYHIRTYIYIYIYIYMYTCISVHIHPRNLSRIRFQDDLPPTELWF